MKTAIEIHSLMERDFKKAFEQTRIFTELGIDWWDADIDIVSSRWVTKFRLFVRRDGQKHGISIPFDSRKIPEWLEEPSYDHNTLLGQMLAHENYLERYKDYMAFLGNVAQDMIKQMKRYFSEQV